MAINPSAGQPAQPSNLVDIPRLISLYFANRPDPKIPEQRVTFGTSGHRGSALHHAFNEWHILAITQAICEYRHGKGIDGPLFLGIDTHPLSEPAFASALEVLAANSVSVLIAPSNEYTPTPAVSRAILNFNRDRKLGLADGIVVTPSHNPPEDGGFKYDPPHGGPASSEITGFIQNRANELIENGLHGVTRVLLDRALRSSTTQRHDFLGEYVGDLSKVIDFEALRGTKLKLGVDPLGG